MNVIKGKKGFASRPILDRINERIKKTESCWIWTGSKTGGNSSYGIIYYEGRSRLVHRILYELRNGKIPDGLELDHLCRNKLCVNPDHLEAVTHRENILRSDSGLAQKMKTHCPKGHEYSPENTRITHGSRNCKACESLYNKRRWARSKADREAIAKAEK